MVEQGLEMTSLSLAFDRLPWCLYRLNRTDRTEMGELCNWACHSSGNLLVQNWSSVCWYFGGQKKGEVSVMDVGGYQNYTGLGQSERYALPLGVNKIHSITVCRSLLARQPKLPFSEECQD